MGSQIVVAPVIWRLQDEPHGMHAQVPPGVRANGSEQEAKLRDHGRPAGL